MERKIEREKECKRERESVKDIGLRGREKMQNFTEISSLKNFVQICLDWFGWLKILTFDYIFYWKTNTVKYENIFLKIFYIETNRAYVTPQPNFIIKLCV